MTKNDNDTDDPFAVPHRPERQPVRKTEIMAENETITVDLESFAFWQAEMAHSSAKAKNNPKHDGDSVHRAYEQMSDVLQEYHSSK